MKSLKKQMAVISVLMVLIIAALTLGGLQLFGKGKVKPSEWFKSNVAQAEQTAPERAATFTRGALLADNDGISMYSSDYEFELSLNGKTLSADWVSFNNVGWVWLLCYCEGVKSDYAVKMTTKEKAVKFFQKYWWIIALALCGIVLVCVTFVSILRKR